MAGTTARLVFISERDQAAVVFGPEDRGLSSEDIRFCRGPATIPTAGFFSLDPARAVMVMRHEIRRIGRPFYSFRASAISSPTLLENRDGFLIFPPWPMTARSRSILL
ncbi:hypothetical protein EPICR_20182 [Candidatus Desulfarcum epimagneticum]|uniref:tRNA/rRNA methyltransferase SpoU type domain-containing protein n=1 Tax=uncultured Desulfobacteraceae bacterium TaxID=218296 RepID=A0A484HGA8_9BACT|nr:hypothetical protein EPICR_20182 [uncultured Desulfobacteraceae bacterium]